MLRSSIGLRIAAGDMIRAEQMRRDVYVPLLDRLRDGWPIMTWMTDYNTLLMDDREQCGWPVTRWMTDYEMAANDLGCDAR